MTIAALTTAVSLLTIMLVHGSSFWLTTGELARSPLRHKWTRASTGCLSGSVFSAHVRAVPEAKCHLPEHHYVLIVLPRIINGALTIFHPIAEIRHFSFTVQCPHHLRDNKQKISFFDSKTLHSNAENKTSWNKNRSNGDWWYYLNHAGTLWTRMAYTCSSCLNHSKHFTLHIVLFKPWINYFTQVTSFNGTNKDRSRLPKSYQQIVHREASMP